MNCAEKLLEQILKEQTIRIHISFRMFQAMDGKIGKFIMSHLF